MFWGTAILILPVELMPSFLQCFYLRRQLAAGQVMGPVVVVVLLLLFKTFTHVAEKEARYLERKRRKVVYEGIQP